MSSIVVTGSYGFIGTEVSRLLRAEGNEVLDLDERAGADIQLRAHVNPYLLGGAEAPAGVIHLAGVLGTHELFADLDRAIRVNIEGMANLLRAITMAQEKYGTTIPLVVIDQPHIWTNPYETTKQAAVDLARAFSTEYGIPLSIVEAFNAYGPGQANGIGHPQKIIPTFATNAWQGNPIPVWGDGEQLVDLVWVGDVADLLAEGLDRGAVGGVREYAGTGVGITVNDVAELVIEHVSASGGPIVRVKHLPMRRGEQKVPDDHYVSPVKTFPFRLDRLIETIDSYRVPF